MKLDLLKTFCDVVDTASVSRAAQVSGVSQPAVSQQLARLERTFGTQLINRGGGLLAPTEAGRVLYEGAKEMLRRYERLFSEVRSAADAVRGVLRVGTIYSVGYYRLDPCVRRLLQSYPEVDLRVEYTHWHRIYAAVISGEMDLGIVAYPQRQRFIDTVPFGTEELVVVTSPRHRLAGRRRVAVSELEGERFVAFEANVPTRRHIDRMLKRCGVKVEVVMAFDNIETLKRTVEVDQDLSIVPAENVQRELADGRLCCARFQDPAGWTRPLGILLRRGKAATPAARIFLRILREAT